MGYTTTFEGIFHLNKRLFDVEVLYLLEFAKTRRMKRNVAQLANAPDPAREAVGLPVGEDGCYFVNEKWDRDSETSIIDYNRPPRGQPGLWCQWMPTADGGGIEWDGGEKFYYYVEWLQYLINHFIGPWGYALSGEVQWQGESWGDRGYIAVDNNLIISPDNAEEMLKYAVSPVQVPLMVWRGIEAVQKSGTSLMFWHHCVEKARELGYWEAPVWMESNVERYYDGLQRGFEADGQVIECEDGRF